MEDSFIAAFSLPLSLIISFAVHQARGAFLMQQLFRASAGSRDEAELQFDGDIA